MTIGTGVDLFGKSTSVLQGYGLTASEAMYLAQYNSFRGAAADAIVRGQNPNLPQPQLSQEAVNRLDNGAYDEYYGQVESEFNGGASFATFQQLPAGAQTAILSVGYQYGPNLSAATPNFYSQITNGQWQDAVANLRNFGDDFGPRRNLEADQLEAAINIEQIPTPSAPCQ